MPLDRFGYTRTQDTVYKALLRRRTATGYAVARDTKLARANVYQALDSLVDGGLAVASGGRPVLYTAVGAEEAVERLAARLEKELASLARELEAPGAGRRIGRPEAHGFARLDGRRRLVAAAGAAADAARSEILAVVGPWADDLYGPLQRARQRGAAVRMVALGRPAPDGAVLRAVPESELIGYWGGMPVVLVADRSRAVCGVVTGEQADGVETRSLALVPFLRHLLRRELASAAGARPS